MSVSRSPLLPSPHPSPLFLWVTRGADSHRLDLTFLTPHPLHTECIVNAPKAPSAKHYAREKNPLKNLGALIKINPQAEREAWQGACCCPGCCTPTQVLNTSCPPTQVANHMLATLSLA